MLGEIKMELNLKELRCLLNVLGDATTSDDIAIQGTEIARLFTKTNDYIMATYYHEVETNDMFGKGTEMVLNETI